MHLRLLTFAISTLLLSCAAEHGKNQDMDLLLTTNSWDLQREEQKPMAGSWVFWDDGTYLEDTHLRDSKSPGFVLGRWSWRNDEELILRRVQISYHGHKQKIDEEAFYIFRITKLTKDSLEGVIRHSADSDAGVFAKQMVFTKKKSKVK